MLWLLLQALGLRQLLLVLLRYLCLLLRWTLVSLLLLLLRLFWLQSWLQQRFLRLEVQMLLLLLHLLPQSSFLLLPLLDALCLLLQLLVQHLLQLLRGIHGAGDSGICCCGLHRRLLLGLQQLLLLLW